MHGYSIDIGINKHINNNLSLGFVVKNLGKEISDHLRVNNFHTLGLGVAYFVPDTKLLFIFDIIEQGNEDYMKLALETNFPYINFIFGSTHSKNYQDISFGLKIDYKDWSLIYGNLNHDNPILGNPNSIEIKKYF